MPFGSTATWKGSEVMRGYSRLSLKYLLAIMMVGWSMNDNGFHGSNVFSGIWREKRAWAAMMESTAARNECAPSPDNVTDCLKWMFLLLFLYYILILDASCRKYNLVAHVVVLAVKGGKSLCVMTPWTLITASSTSFESLSFLTKRQQVGLSNLVTESLCGLSSCFCTLSYYSLSCMLCDLLPKVLPVAVS